MNNFVMILILVFGSYFYVYTMMDGEQSTHDSA